MSRTAIIDIDNTLWQFCDAFYLELAKINKDFPRPDAWNDWDIWEGYCSKLQFYEAVNSVHAKQDSDGYLPYSDARDFLTALRQCDYHITIASHRSPSYREPTERWLQKHGLVYDDLHLSFEKTKLINELTNVVVDDSPQVLKKAAQNGTIATGLLFPWNREYANDGFRLYTSLNDILSYILNM